MRRAAVVTYAVAVLAFAGVAGVPWLTKKRDFPAAVTSPPPVDVVTLVVVPPRERVCMRDVALDPHGDQVRFKVGTYGKPGPPLAVSVRGAGYDATGRLAAGYADNLEHSVAIARPPRSELATVCIRNGGRATIAFYGAHQRSQSRVLVDVGGEPVDASPMLAFYESRPVSIADRLTTTLSRMAVFRGPLGYPAVIWAILALFVVGVPLALGAALARAFAGDQRRAGSSVSSKAGAAADS